MPKILSDGKFYRVPVEAIDYPTQLINYSRKKGDNFYKVEDCLANKLVLQRHLKKVWTIGNTWGGMYSIGTPNVYTQGLKDYQIDDILKMCKTNFILNRNPMGLGKTVETVVLMRWMRMTTVLIVCPKSVMLQWKKTIEEWYPEFDGEVFINSTEPPVLGNIYIYNYERITSNKTIFEALQKVAWDLHVCDEAHRIKNPKSKRTIAMNNIASRRRIALTGTPITNKPNDLFGILHWVSPYYSGRSYWNFTNYFCNIKQDPWGQKIEGLTKDEFRVKVLHKLLEEVSIYNQIEVARGKQIITVPLEMHKRQAALFKKAKKLMLDELPETLTIANGAVLATRLQQITSCPAIFDCDEELNRKSQTFGQGVKFEWIEDMVADNENESFVIFTKFSYTATLLCMYLRDTLGIIPAMYTGDFSETLREKDKERFIKRETRVIIGTIGAMGEGVDGLQTVSHTAIFIDRDWTPSVMEQAEDRLNRTGQTKPVLCYYLECEKSFDQYVGKVNLQKADDIRRALENED